MIKSWFLMLSLLGLVGKQVDSLQCLNYSIKGKQPDATCFSFDPGHDSQLCLHGSTAHYLLMKNTVNIC